MLERNPLRNRAEFAYLRHMSTARSTPQTHVAIDGRDFLLAPDQDIDDLKQRIEDAARSGGTFVGFESGGVLLSALISRTSQVIVAVVDESSSGSGPDMSGYEIVEWEY
ncbi:hypothetical protein RS85_01183 [Microbacterium sp. SA39]|nr:hypothetical protein RS85_01183 [Microbacterium sp. SA39]